MASWTIPGYTERRTLGSGGSGRVVLATHDATGTDVAIKYLADEFVHDEDFIGAFRDEAMILSEVESPYVTQIYDFVESADSAAIVMELVDGISLRSMLREHGPAEPESALVALKGSLLGLAAAHQRGVVHRDYKPENVLVDANGNSKLADFGMAARTGHSGMPGGTLSYMAPEQWAGAAATPQTDIYAATATFFECLTGHPPFRASDDRGLLRHLHEQASIPVELAPEALSGLLQRGLAKSASQRPRNAMTFLRELEAVAGSAYGADWEDEGKKQLARRAALLALLFPLLAQPAADTAAASTSFAWTTLTKAKVVGAITLILAAGGIVGWVALPNEHSAAAAPPPSSASPPAVEQLPPPSAPAGTTPSPPNGPPGAATTPPTSRTSSSPPPPSQAPGPGTGGGPGPGTGPGTGPTSGPPTAPPSSPKTSAPPSSPPSSPKTSAPPPPPSFTLGGFDVSGGTFASPSSCTSPTCFRMFWDASVQATGSGAGTLHVQFRPTNSLGSLLPASASWDLDFNSTTDGTISWDSPSADSASFSQACQGQGSVSIVGTITVNGVTTNTGSGPTLSCTLPI